ncbi:MAG: GNAT family N-acetyltransferase [Betaproteobacteria bacterium]|nr:GNAT family N-acetyltransferase [Betaproteobacteria bacterium]MBV9359781.1 GNAT family N-acetyltransferase [Betaproteobacteria bacterium]
MSIDVRPLPEADLASADRIFRLAFGTFIGLKDPLSFRGDAEMIRTRWRSQPDGAFGAYRDGELIGSSIASCWGSFGVFGPISVHPDRWEGGIGQRLAEPAIAALDRWGVRQSALFTFAQSPKHIALYQKFGFWPQMLTCVMAKETLKASAAFELCNEAGAVSGCAAVTNAVFPGLDTGREIKAVLEQKLGDIVVLREEGKIHAFALCHVGRGSEAGSGAAFIKFGAVRPGHGAPGAFRRLVAACESLAVARGASRLVAGVNTARRSAYRILVECGFRAFFNGVAMQRPDEVGFNHSDSCVIDDWR